MQRQSRANLAAVALVVAGCSSVPRDIAEHPPLSAAFATRFPVGAAVEPWQLDTREGALFAWHFNGVVAENAMKATQVQPAEGRFEFKEADRIVEFAQKRGMRIRGHTLLWHEETPDWMWRGPGGAPASREQVLERLRKHIEAVITRYRGRVASWDVVNEVIDSARPDCLRDTRWLQVAGPEYIEAALRAAHAADPDARLLVNDYETTDPARRACLLRLVGELRARGVPVHGIGHQMHAKLDHPSAAAVDETLAAFAALGLDNEITELDMTLGPPTTDGADAALLARQAERYAELFRVFVRRPDVKAVTFWGVSDSHSWLNMKRDPARPDRPLLFDAEQRPKPAYHAIAAIAR